MKKQVLYAVCILTAAFLCATAARAAEPVMSSYVSQPIFQSASVMPNILIMLDNSGSMNFPAYPDPYNPDDSGLSYGTKLTGAYFKGGACKVTSQISSGNDDAEERLKDNAIDYCGFDYRRSSDLDLCQDDYRSRRVHKKYCAEYEEQVVGLRFQNVDIPDTVNGQPVTITGAYIVFTAYIDSAKNNKAELYIAGEATDDAAAFTTAKGNISGRPETAAKVTWADVGRWSTNSQANATTPDLKAIVQEIVARPGWAPGNDMVFKITGKAGSRRRAHSYNSSKSRAPMLVITYEPCVVQKYYGYFDADARYSYSAGDSGGNGYFYRDAGGTWNGNFLNWVSMRRIDVLRKALMGGKKPCESCGGKTHLQGDDSKGQPSRYWQVYHDGIGDSPFPQAWWGVKDGKLYVKGSDDPWNSPDAYFTVEVAIDQTENPELFCTDGTEAGNPCGIIQKVGDQARWGNIWFDTSNEGGEVSSAIGGGVRDIINDFQSTEMDTATPLAETLLTSMKYFQQSCTLPSGYGEKCSNWGLGATTDPFFDKNQLIPCAKSFVLMLTDGVPTRDTNIPSTYRDYDGDNNEGTRSVTDYLDDVALYSHVNDLRSDLEGDQTMDTYVIYAFGKNEDAKVLLKETAMAGGFVDRNGNKRPDGYNNDGKFTAVDAGLRKEWDKNGDGIPDNFYDAQDGYQLESQLLAAINSILNKAASGTAVSVLATTGEGEGTLVQAIFRPGITDGISEVNWIGFLQSLWVDPKGNIREDTNKNAALDVDVDRIISYYFDSATSETMVKRYPVSASNPYPDKDTTTPELLSLEDLGPTAIWEAGALLADRPANERNIYTYVGADDGTGKPQAGSPIPFGTSPCVAFHEDNVASIQPFLGVQDNNGTTPVYATQPYAYLGATIDVRAKNLINFIRGSDAAGDGVGGPALQGSVSVRDRVLDGKVWKLGDIVYSTPVTISKAVERYGLIYDDMGYQAYANKYSDTAAEPRETIVYVGGNDGMLHAFTSGIYDAESRAFVQKEGTAERIGDELWAYIPRALLPHLKWLASRNYTSLTHVPYVDLKPKIIDVRIFDEDAVHPGGWGTVLVGGMNYGGKHIWVNDKSGSSVANYYSSFFAIDITDPRHPQLLWDKWFPDLGLTINQPTVIQVGRTYDETSRSWNNDDNWYLVFGSGYNQFQGWVLYGQQGSLYVVDIKTGELKKQFRTAETYAYMNTPLAIDKSLNYSVDALYAASNYWDTSLGWFQAKIWRLGIPINDPYVEGFDALYETDPEKWTWAPMVYDRNLALTSAPFTISSDQKDNVWLYVGTGRYETLWDKGLNFQNWLMGVKDPFYNRRGWVEGDTAVAAPDCYHSYTATDCTISNDDLFYANPYMIKPGNVVQPLAGGETSITSWDKLIEWVEQKDSADNLEIYQGWYRGLETNGSDPSERMINKPTVLGGIAVFPAYTPNADLCGYGGSSQLYALYYETGTAYSQPVLTALDNTVEIQYKTDLGYGLSSSFGVHSAKERGGGSTLYSQMSTGLINEVFVIGAFSNKSGVENWKEGR